MKGSSSQEEKLDRKTIERNRRIHMKGLCFKLTSLIPPHRFKPSKEFLSQQNQLDQAATYIKQLKERIEELKGKKKLLAMRMQTTPNDTSTTDTSMMEGSNLPVVELRDFGSSLEVVLISGLKNNFMLYEAISVLEDEGAEVVSASFSTFGDKVMHTLHAKVKVLRFGVETSRVHERLRELIY